MLTIANFPAELYKSNIIVVFTGWNHHQQASLKIASTGHSITHMPQSTHDSGRNTTETPSRMPNTEGLQGQIASQTPQPTQRGATTTGGTISPHTLSLINQPHG